LRADRPRCSERSLALSEPQHGTASTVANWVLLEQPGPWGYNALLESRIPPELARALVRRSRDLRFRVVLIRRPGRDGSRSQHQCYLVHTGPDRPWMESLLLTGPGDLLDLDLEPWGHGDQPGLGRIDDGPLFLACTNGRRDPCCAERGRPLAAALARSFSPSVWECSHIGGDRFAGNLVCFPHGIYFGRVGPEECEGVARAYTEGRLSLRHYRGRSCYPFDVQAAEFFVRQTFGLTGIGEVEFAGREQEVDGGVRMTFIATGKRMSVVVRSRPATPSRALTCHANRPSRPPEYEVLLV
jgi:hypothetical protein